MTEEFEDARNYFANSWGALKQQNRRLIALCCASILCNLLLAAALVALMPLKETRVKIVEVNTLTGQTKVGGSVDPALFHNEALKKYWLQTYVLARLTYDYADAKEAADTVILLTQQSILGEYQNEVDPRRTDSPAGKWGDTKKRKARIVSITLDREDLARVRVETQIVHNGGADTPVPYIATIKFKYTATPGEELHLIENPLGFQVVSWRLDKEITQ